MTTEGFKRKLTAILSADVKGYSRLMGEDEEATVRTITEYREVMATLIQQHRGRVVDSPGDNLLAEFASVVDALRCAWDIQQEFKNRNDDLPENRRMNFRIGVNLGDVIEEDERIYGDGVNIAARLEALADEGGICISGTAYDQVKSKLPFKYNYHGEQPVKNIKEPVRVYKVMMAPEEAADAVVKRRVKPRQWQWAVLALLVAGAMAAASWHFYLRPAPLTREATFQDKMALPLPDKPSIAVLPFKNLSGDREQEYFSDGITNDIITDISKFRELFVIASNSVFTYKGKHVKVKDVGRELGVRYVLEGSIQKAGDKLRINAQLIEAATGRHLWAERYERDLKDLFSVQDEIVQAIVTTLAIKIDEVERVRVMRKDTDSLEAYDYLLRGMEYYSLGTRSANIKAQEMFQKAIERDPRYASAYVGLAQFHLNHALMGWTQFPNKKLQQAEEFAQKALSFEESNAGAHIVLGTLYLYRTQYDLATSELQRAIKLNPNDARSYSKLGRVMLYTSQTDEAILLMEKSLRLDPRLDSSISFGTIWDVALAYYLKGRYDDAIGVLKRGLGRRPDFVWYHITLAAAYAQSGRSEKAAREAATVLRLNPFFEVDSFGTLFRNPADRAAIADGLRKAGLK
jgi:adenylate cyclase